MRKGSGLGNSLFYLNKAVEESEDDETALVLRSRWVIFINFCKILSTSYSRCLFSMGKYEDAISDAKAALMKNSLSMEARHNLGKALYSSGQFETALLHFYRASRYL